MKTSKWQVKEQALFLIELGELLDLGYSLLHALHFLRLNKSIKKAKELDYAVELLRGGHPLHSVLDSLKFHRSMTSYVFFSEQHGMLSSSLKEAGTFWMRRCKDGDKIKKLMFYPVLLLFFALLVFYGFDRMLLPKFQVLFSSMDTSANIYLNTVITFSKLIKLLPCFLAAVAALCLTVYFIWYKNLNPLKKRAFLVKIPIAGNFIRLYTTQFFTSQLSGLLTGGLSINESFQLFSKTKQQPFFQQLSEKIQAELTRGRTLDSILSGIPYFEKNLAAITASGQKYGKLDKELYYYSKKLLSVMEERIELYQRIIQPALFSIIGVLIVSIYMAVLLPMYSLLNTL
ncbi:competence type IV pilus assembly protein ComGB [Peribacillus sp. SCS-37]|uniref:competence type IV pilus assembly protein ComGB n=1 Tax=Paraperibacillus esterisolvens TaxID=3115296 RepID=UPI00390610A0